MLTNIVCFSTIAEQQSPTKKRRLEEGWEPYTAADGQSVDLPPVIMTILKSNEFKPDPREDFSSLLDVRAGSQIVTKNLGQAPKYFGEGYQGTQFFVTEQMKEIWDTLAGDSDRSIKKVLSGPMGVGKSYLAWFLAAQAYAHGWPVLYIADAAQINRASEEKSSMEICNRFLAINKDILTAAELKVLVEHEDKSKAFVVSCADIIFTDLLQRRDRKTLLIVDEHGALFKTDPPAPDRLWVLQPLKEITFWGELMAGARVVLTGTAHAKFERVYLQNGRHLIYVGPLSPAVFDRLLTAVFSRFHPNVRGYTSAIKDKVLKITNRVPRELVNLAQKIGTGPLTLEQVTQTLSEFEALRRKEFLFDALTHYNSLSVIFKETTRLALADMFLPGKIRPTGGFDWQFLDFGIVYRYKDEDGVMVRHNPICPAAMEALLDLYKRCPLPEAYLNGLARDNLDGPQFEDALFQQLMRLSDVTLRTTDIAGKHEMDMRFKITRFELLQQPPVNYGTDGMDILIRCYKGYPRFDFILGYTFIQVSVSDFAKHNTDSAVIDFAFKRNGAKNQIEDYLDAMFGGTHSAVINESPNPKDPKKVIKTFVVSKDGRLCPQFQIVYMRGSPGKPNHTSKVQEYPGLRHISYEDIKSKLFGAPLTLFAGKNA